jgi:hypothetical protein
LIATDDSDGDDNCSKDNIEENDKDEENISTENDNECDKDSTEDISSEVVDTPGASCKTYFKLR